MSMDDSRFGGNVLIIPFVIIWTWIAVTLWAWYPMFEDWFRRQ